MFKPYGLQEVSRVALPNKNGRARIANISFIAGKWTLGLELVVLLKLHLIMHVSRWVSRAADLLSNCEPLLLKDYAAGFNYGEQKRSC